MLSLVETQSEKTIRVLSTVVEPMVNLVPTVYGLLSQRWSSPTADGEDRGLWVRD